MFGLRYITEINESKKGCKKKTSPFFPLRSYITLISLLFSARPNSSLRAVPEPISLYNCVIIRGATPIRSTPQAAGRVMLTVVVTVPFVLIN